MSPLAEALADYLALRRSLGHKLDDAGRQLTRFVASLDVIGAEVITMEAVRSFVLDPELDPAGSNPTRRLSAVRGLKAFARDMLSKPRVPAMIRPAPITCVGHGGSPSKVTNSIVTTGMKL